MGGSAERRARVVRRVLIDLAPLRRSRDLRLLVLGELVSVLGTQLTTVAVPYQVYQLTHSSLDVGLACIAGALVLARLLPGFRRQRTPTQPPQRARQAGQENSLLVTGGLGHLQQCSRLSLSTLGGGGNRTRVLQCITRASPGAARSAFLSPGDHASKAPTGSVAVRCPAWPRDRVRR